MSRHPEDGKEGHEGDQPQQASTPPSHLPRRRMLRWALGLVPAAVGGGWAAFRWLDKPGALVEELGPEDGYLAEAGLARGGPTGKKLGNEAWAVQLTQEAAPYCFAGHEGASSILSLAYEAAPNYAPARLLSACWFMHEGRWDLVQEDLEVPTLRDTPEGRLLRELAKRRPHAPSWRHAFFESWQALGRPDFRESTLLPEPLAVNTLLANTQVAWPYASEAKRLAMGVLNLDLVKPNQTWVLEQLRASPSIPLLLALREHLLAYEAEAPPRQLLLPVVEERLGQLAGPSPRTLQLALVPFLAGSLLTTPFERRDLETLEQLLALPTWKHHSSEAFFLEMRALFDGLHAPGHHAWMMATWAQGVSLGIWLLHRARATKPHLSEDDRRWMGRLLWTAGARLREQPSGQELDRGLRLQMAGAELLHHAPTHEECIAAWVELGRWEEALKQAAYSRWPLAPLQEESFEPRARNEHLWMQAFTGQGPLP